MNSRSACFLAFFAAMTVSATPGFAGLLPDIRGINFGVSKGSFQGVEVFGGQVAIPGLGTTFYEDNATRDATSFDPFPGTSPVPTFSIVANPKASNDPTQIDIQTRFAFGGLVTPISEIVSWNLLGTYNRTTGVISVSGAKSDPTGSILFNVGVFTNPFGDGQDFEDILGFTNLTYSLHGTLTQVTGGLTITGTDPVVPVGGLGNIGVSGTTMVYFNPVGGFNIANVLVTGTIASGQAYGGFYNWSATTAAAVPEPPAWRCWESGCWGMGANAERPPIFERLVITCTIPVRFATSKLCF